MIQYRSFKVGVAETSSERLNSFLRQNTVISIDKQFVSAGAESFFFFLVEYDAATPETKYDRRERVDYANILDERQFAAFNKLREYRAKTAKEQGVPPYVIFTNEMAASMVRLQAVSRESLQGIDGFGKSKMEKYGDTILMILRRYPAHGTSNETNRLPV